MVVLSILTVIGQSREGSRIKICLCVCVRGAYRCHLFCCGVGTMCLQKDHLSKFVGHDEPLPDGHRFPGRQRLKQHLLLHLERKIGTGSATREVRVRRIGVTKYRDAVLNRRRVTGSLHMLADTWFYGIPIPL